MLPLIDCDFYFEIPVPPVVQHSCLYLTSVRAGRCLLRQEQKAPERYSFPETKLFFVNGFFNSK